jgi:hypothetical protein
MGESIALVAKAQNKPHRKKPAAEETPKRKPKAKASKSEPATATRRRAGGETGVATLARSHAAAAVAALVAVMEDATASPSARIAAAGALLQWGFGKAPAIPAAAARAELQKTIVRHGGPQLIRLSWAAPRVANDNDAAAAKAESEEPSA